jgi:hypothetical protein
MKKVIAFFAAALVAGLVLAEVKTVTVGAAALTGTWTNSETIKRDREVKTAYITLGTNSLVDTVSVYVTSGGIDYLAGSATITSNYNGTVTFSNKVAVQNGDSVKIARTAASTSTVANVLLVIE